MKTPRRNILAILDNAVRWTGIPARVADDMSGAPDRKHRPLRWIPIWMIAFSCTLFILSLAWPPALDMVAITVSFMGSIAAIAPGIHICGPLGKSSLEDDEREAALRKDSFLFCFGLLTLLNCVGQLLLMSLSHLQNWQTAQSVFVAASAFMLNLTLFGCLPTLYASWNMPQLPKE
ncbi:MAG TPA: hypothetical protein VEW08_13245 [Steroidobacteraceae bacterium]|nr:hypothetical protein [Steroidobacteraceae bacterium]